MAKLIFDADALKSVLRAPSNPEEAAQALKFAASYIRAGEELPLKLKEWLVDALEQTAKTPQKFRVRKLAQCLSLQLPNRRPSANWLEVVEAMERKIDEGMSQSEAAGIVGDEFKLDESTVRRHWKKYQKARANHRAVDAE